MTHSAVKLTSIGSPMNDSNTTKPWAGRFDAATDAFTASVGFDQRRSGQAVPRRVSVSQAAPPAAAS